MRAHRPLGRRLPTLATAVIAVSLAGCGVAAGSSAGHPAASPARIDRAFVEKVGAWCADTSRQLTAAQGSFPFPTFDPEHPDPALLPQVGRFFARGAPVRDAEAQQLRALGEPATGAAVWEGLRNDVVTSIEVAQAQIRAALAGDTAAFVRNVHQVRDDSNALHAAATAAGFPANSPCGQLF